MDRRLEPERTRPPAPAAAAARAGSPRVGVLFGVGAYALWGVFPLYFKAVETVPAVEVLTHRIVWSVPFLVALLVLRRRLGAAIQALGLRRTLLTLCLTAMMISVNWLLFIWAVAHDQVMQASLGYFINPLINVLLGFLFLRERLRRQQALSVGLAAAGVTYLTFAYGRFPAIALVLAFSFGFYGLLRKTARIGALEGLTVETALLSPFAATYLGWQMWAGEAVFGATSVGLTVLLMLAGIVTATPLLWFTEAARRLRLATLGFLQYLAPTGHFLIALAYGEPFTMAHLVAFACIWTALVIYSVDAALSSRRPPPAPVPE